MQILQNMDMDNFIVIVPAALVVMYLIISFQKSLCERDNPYAGLIIPFICFITATVLAFRPMFILTMDGSLLWFCIKMWLTFNIPTVAFLFPYFRCRQQKKALREAVKVESEQ